MHNTPAHMKSIWSKGYTTLKNSSPFAFSVTNKKEPTVTLPNTCGLSKTINSKSFLNKQNTTLNEDTLLNKDNIAKRKFDSTLSLAKYSSFSSSLASTTELTDSDTNSCDSKENDAQLEKRFKKDELDIDTMLNEYSSNDTKHFETKFYIESSSESSAYFTSSSLSTNSMASPILNRVYILIIFFQFFLLASHFSLIE